MNKKAYYAEYYQKNRERIKARVAARRAQNPEKAREEVRRCWEDPEKRAKYLTKRAEWYPAYAPVARKRAKEWAAAHPERTKQAAHERGKIWREGKAHLNAAKANRYRAAKLQRTPIWLTADDHWLIEQAYELAALRTKVTGFQWHVDHVVPLQGKCVSGFHVPTNLQVLPAAENVRKSARFAEVT